MKYQKTIKILENEKECVKRADKNNCNRNCLNCELVQNTETILNAFDTAISALEKQIPQKVRPSLRGTTDYDCRCPNCDNPIFLGRYCRECGQALDWSD